MNTKNTPASTLNLTPAAPKNDGPTTQTEGSATVNTADGNHPNATTSAGQQAQFTTPVSRRVNTNTTADSTRTATSNTAEAKDKTTPATQKNQTEPGNRTTKRAKLKQHNAKRNAAQTKRQKAKRNKPTSRTKFVPEAADRFELSFFLKHFPGVAMLNLPEKISDQVAVMYKFALATNPHKLVYLATALTHFLPHFDKNPEAYSGPNPHFTERKMGGDPIKVQLLSDMVAIMFKAGWLTAYNSKEGGVMMWLRAWAGWAMKRCLSARKTDGIDGKTVYFDPNFFVSSATSIDDNSRTYRSRKAQAALSTSPGLLAEEESERFEKIEETHRNLVNEIRGWVTKYLTMDARSRRKLKPKFLGLFKFQGIEPHEVGFPPTRAYRKQTGPKATPLCYTPGNADTLMVAA